jgi:3-methyladenine DNA glycosylase/8-oxoguanine DNA glycosylase
VNGRPDRTLTVTPALRTDLLPTLRPLVASRQDPTIRVRPTGMARACHTPEGPGTLVATRTAGQGFAVRAYGPGAAWLAERAGDVLGVADDLTGFDAAQHPAVARAHHRRPGLRMLRTGTVVDVLVPTIIAQRVTSLEAARSWTRLVRTLGTPAPGPFGLWLPPPPDHLARTPAARLHTLGIERARARRIVDACREVAHLEAALPLTRTQRLARFAAVPGIGEWTAAHLARVAAGDADAVEVGDHNVKHLVAWNLAGEARGTDERMLELLAPFAGHRGRVVRLLSSAGQPPPRFGPRLRLHPVEQL